jgi:GTPase SAR1 family protein
MAKIGLCGSMSVGKTSLVNALKQLPEFKDYKVATERSKYLNSLGIPLNTDSTLNGQTIFLAERSAELMHDNLITDRTVIDVMAFTQAAKSINYLDKSSFYEYARNFISQYDYIFYIPTENTVIEDNGIRETDPEYRKLIDFIIQSVIDNNKHRIKNYNIIKGTTEERIQQILKVLNNV